MNQNIQKILLSGATVLIVALIGAEIIAGELRSISRKDPATSAYFTAYWSPRTAISSFKDWKPLEKGRNGIYSFMQSNGPFVTVSLSCAPDSLSSYWNRNNENKAEESIIGAAVIAAFKAPADGIYTISGIPKWKLTSFQNSGNAAFKVAKIQADGTSFVELFNALLHEPGKAFIEPRPVEGFAGNTNLQEIPLKKDDLLAFILLGSSSNYRGIWLDDSEITINSEAIPNNLAPATRSSSAVSGKINPDDIADELLKHLDLQQPGLEKVKQLSEAGKMKEALAAYRDYFVEKCSRLPVENCRYWAFAYTNPEKLLEEGIVGMGAYDGKTTAGVKIGKPGKVNWFPEVPEILYFASDLPRFYWANKLARRYVSNRDPRYLEAFVGYFADHARNHQRQYKAFMRTDWQGRYERPEWSVKTILFHADRLHVFRTGIIAACQTNGTVSFDREPAVPVENASLEQVRQAIDPEALAAALLGFADGTLNRFLDGRLNLPATPNQQLDMAYCMLTYAHLLGGFKNASRWEECAAQAYDRYFNAGALLADGTDMEQSFNYNWGPVGKTIGLLLWYPDPATRPDWVKRSYNRALYRLRMYAALVKPTGPVPGMGTYSATGNRDGFREAFEKFNAVFDDPLTAKVLNRQWGESSMAAPAFTSIAFPYGGYYALRSGWDKRDQFLFFKASRPGTGHCEGNDILNVQLTAFGKDLLPRAGAVNYDIKDPYRPYFLQSFSANTVVVDGLSINTHPFQNKVATYAEPLDGRWHTSAAFDFTEGAYRHGYGKGNPSTISDITHQRQILFVKQAGLWIVVDRMNSENTHRSHPKHIYSQIWNLHPDFAAGQVVCDDNRARIETQAPDAANIGLYHFGASPRSYTTFRGQMQPEVRGWAKTQEGLVEATDIHVNWQGGGDQLLVTLIEPRPGLESAISELKAAGENGFTATLRNGTEIAFQTALTPQSLSAGSLKANATALLAVRNPQDDTTRGIALDCTRFRDKNPAAGSFEFEVEPGSRWRFGRPRTRIMPITVPTGFTWIKTRDGMVPQYQ